MTKNDHPLSMCQSREIIISFNRSFEMLEVPLLDDLIHLFQSCACDLRRTLLTLQFLAQSSSTMPVQSSTGLSSASPTKFPSSKVFDTMFYSYLHEQWEESLLKPLFDDLTSKYTSDYEQSRSKNNPNESKR